MIFVTVGTREESFDRLIEAIDELAPSLDEEIHVQLGHTNYEPEHAEWFRFTDAERIEELYATADLVVAHGGAGTVLSALSNGTPVVLVPRYERYDEAQNDHQLDLAEALERREDILVVYDIADLGEAIESARTTTDRVDRIHREEGNQLERFLDDYLDSQGS